MIWTVKITKTEKYDAGTYDVDVAEFLFDSAEDAETFADTYLDKTTETVTATIIGIKTNGGEA